MPLARFALLIVPAGDRDRANAATQLIPGSVPADRDTFSVGLSPTGAAPATHYWAAGVFQDEAWPALKALADAFPGAYCGAYDPDDDPRFPERLLLTLDLQRISRRPQETP